MNFTKQMIINKTYLLDTWANEAVPDTLNEQSHFVRLLKSPV